MRFFSVCLFLLVALSKAHGAFNEPLVIKQVSEDGGQFVFVRREGDAPWNGITVKDPHTKVMLYEVKVLKCSPKACVGSIVRNYSGLKIRMDEEYLHSYNDKPIKFDTNDTARLEPKAEPVPPPVAVVAPVAVPAPEPEPIVVEEPKPQPKPKPAAKPVVKKKPSALDRAGYLAYGTPIGPGFKLGYFGKSSFGWIGANYGSFASTTNKVSIKGVLLSGSAIYTLMRPTPNIDVSAIGEAGLVKATLDFTAVDPDAPLEEETSYFWALGGEGKYNLGQFAFALRSGISKTGFAAVYTGTYSEFNNPYATILVFLEIGAYYRF